MPTTPSQVSRVLSAFEDLVSREELLLHAEDYAELVAIQIRIAPLVHFLVEQESAADAAMRQRIASLIASRNRTQQHLVTRMGKMREEIVQLEASRRCIARVAPAYGPRGATTTEPRLSIRG